MGRKFSRSLLLVAMASCILVFSSSCDIYSIVYPTGILTVKNNSIHSIIAIFPSETANVRGRNILDEPISPQGSRSLKGIDRRTKYLEFVLSTGFGRQHLVDYGSSDKYIVEVED